VSCLFDLFLFSCPDLHTQVNSTVCRTGKTKLTGDVPRLRTYPSGLLMYRLFRLDIFIMYYIVLNILLSLPENDANG
jgi:hypothetical protein